VLLIAPFLAGCALLIDRASPILGLLAFVTLAFGLLGLADDAIKLCTPRRGLSVRTKLVFQILLAVATALLVQRFEWTSGSPGVRTIPLVGTVACAQWMLPLWVLLIVGFSNAINITDGLDGLATGCTAWFATGLALAIAATSPAAERELLLADLALLGALLGFLRFNRHPAQVFMGNTGSSALGALVAVLAILSRLEWMLLVAGAVFVAEAVSVLVQVTYYKWRQQRLFRCAPLHHHFQFQDWSERSIVRRFWLAAALCTTLAVVLAVLPRGAELAASPSPRSEENLSQEARLMREIR
jgi:phospho-N-acetylmuramoyl-pentapeptide-transferase